MHKTAVTCPLQPNYNTPTFIIAGLVFILLAGTYLLFPKQEKSEFFYLILMTIVMGGAGDQLIKIFFGKMSSKEAKTPHLNHTKKTGL